MEISNFLNPWPQWSGAKKVDYGQKEATCKQGEDPREYLMTTEKSEGKDGKFVALHTAKVEWGKGDDGRMFPKNVESIFSAGDSRRGQSLVVWAINEGRGCAREVDKYLMGDTYLP